MSIFGFFKSTDAQEETSAQYQSWRDANPDNPSDDDFYNTYAKPKYEKRRLVKRAFEGKLV